MASVLLDEKCSNLLDIFIAIVIEVDNSCGGLPWTLDAQESLRNVGKLFNCVKLGCSASQLSSRRPTAKACSETAVAHHESP